MQKAIIHELPLITDPDQWHNYKKILCVDVIDIGNMEPLKKLKLQINKKAIVFNDRVYLPIFLKGSPASFVNRVTKGFPYQFLPGETTYIIWDGNLPSMIARKKFYDLSTYRNVTDLQILFEHGWLYERFVMPYQNKPLKQKGLNYHLNNTSILSAASLS